MGTAFFRLRTLLGSAAVFCALFFVASVSASDLHDELLQRSEQYLESVRFQSAGLSPHDREMAEKRARAVVRRGLAKLQRPAGSTQGEILGLRIDFDAFRNLRQTGSSGALAFLARNFYRPSERDVALRIALPFRGLWDRTHGVLARHCPIGGLLFRTVVGLGSSETWAVLVSSSNRLFEILLCRSLTTDAFRLFDPVVSRRIADADLVTGFPLIARTIVLRI